MTETSPIILVLPGGGYTHLAPHEGEPVAEWLRSIGWRARVVEYPVHTRHPGPLKAVQDAIAEERAAGASIVGVLGFSAGGHVAGLASVTPDAAPDVRPDFAILGYPVVSMVSETHRGSREQLIGLDASDELRRSVSVDLLVTDVSPPMFIWTTAEDASVAIEDHSYALGAALARGGVHHELHVFERGAHGLGLAPGLPASQWVRLAEAWLQYRR
ncbi:MAG: alpha/beta hydrolase [Rhodoglobus sp.]